MFGAAGPLEHSAAERVAIDGEPRQRRAARRLIHRREHRLHLARLLTDLHFLARRDDVARDVHRLAVHFDVTVANELTRRLAARSEAHAVDHVIEATLKCREKVVARDARERRHLLEGVAELLLADPVDALDLLLLAELLRVLRRLAAARRALPVLAGRDTDDARPGTSR